MAATCSSINKVKSSLRDYGVETMHAEDLMAIYYKKQVDAYLKNLQAYAYNEYGLDPKYTLAQTVLATDRRNLGYYKVKYNTGNFKRLEKLMGDKLKNEKFGILHMKEYESNREKEFQARIAKELEDSRASVNLVERETSEMLDDFHAPEIEVTDSPYDNFEQLPGQGVLPFEENGEETAYSPQVTPVQQQGQMVNTIQELNLNREQRKSLYTNYINLMDRKREGRGISYKTFLKTVYPNLQGYYYKNTLIAGEWDTKNNVFKGRFISSPNLRELYSALDNLLNTVDFVASVPEDLGKMLEKKGLYKLEVGKIYDFRGEVMTKNLYLSNEKLVQKIFKTSPENVTTEMFEQYDTFYSYTGTLKKLKEASDEGAGMSVIFPLLRELGIYDYNAYRTYKKVRAMKDKTDKLRSEIMESASGTGRELREDQLNELTNEINNLVKQTLADIKKNSVSKSLIIDKTDLLNQPKIYEELDTELNKILATYLSKFGITTQILEDVQENLGVDSFSYVDILNKILYTSRNNQTDYPVEAGKVIAFMMQHNPLVSEIIGQLKKKGRFKNATHTEMLEAVGDLIAQELLNKTGGVVLKDLKNRIKLLIDQFMNYLSNIRIDRINTNIAYIADNILIQNQALITSSVYKPGAEFKPIEKISLEEALASDDFGKSIVEKMAPHFILTGSITLSEQGSVFRPSENQMHDIDWVSPYLSDKSKALFEKLYPNNKYIRNIESENNYTDTWLIAPEGYTIENLQLQGKVNKVIGYDIVDSEGNVVSQYDPAKDSHTGEIEAKLIDIFSYKNERLIEENTKSKPMTTNSGIDLRISDWRQTMKAKLEYSRLKDIWDYNRFIPNAEDIDVIQDEDVPYPTDVLSEMTLEDPEEEVSYSPKVVDRDALELEKVSRMSGTVINTTPKTPETVIKDGFSQMVIYRKNLLRTSIANLNALKLRIDNIKEATAEKSRLQEAYYSLKNYTYGNSTLGISGLEKDQKELENFQKSYDKLFQQRYDLEEELHHAEKAGDTAEIDAIRKALVNVNQQIYEMKFEDMTSILRSFVHVDLNRARGLLRSKDLNSLKEALDIVKYYKALNPRNTQGVNPFFEREEILGGHLSDETYKHLEEFSALAEKIEDEIYNEAKSIIINHINSLDYFKRTGTSVEETVFRTESGLADISYVDSVFADIHDNPYSRDQSILLKAIQKRLEDALTEKAAAAKAIEDEFDEQQEAVHDELVRLGHTILANHKNPISRLIANTRLFVNNKSKASFAYFRQKSKNGVLKNKFLQLRSDKYSSLLKEFNRALDKDIADGYDPNKSMTVAQAFFKYHNRIRETTHVIKPHLLPEILDDPKYNQFLDPTKVKYPTKDPTAEAIAYRNMLIEEIGEISYEEMVEEQKILIENFELQFETEKKNTIETFKELSGLDPLEDVDISEVGDVLLDRLENWELDNNPFTTGYLFEENRRIKLDRGTERAVMRPENPVLLPNREIASEEITREEAEKNPDKIYLFSDNLADLEGTTPTSRGSGVIKGLDNAIGIPTKKNRGTGTSSYWSDADYDEFVEYFEDILDEARNSGKTIVFPKNGIGQGASQLKTKAPAIYNYLQASIDEFNYGPITSNNRYDDPLAATPRTNHYSNYGTNNRGFVFNSMVPRAKKVQVGIPANQKDVKDFFKRVQIKETGEPTDYIDPRFREMQQNPILYNFWKTLMKSSDNYRDALTKEDAELWEEGTIPLDKGVRMRRFVESSNRDDDNAMSYISKAYRGMLEKLAVNMSNTAELTESFSDVDITTNTAIKKINASGLNIANRAINKEILTVRATELYLHLESQGLKMKPSDLTKDKNFRLGYIPSSMLKEALYIGEEYSMKDLNKMSRSQLEYNFKDSFNIEALKTKKGEHDVVNILGLLSDLYAQQNLKEGDEDIGLTMRRAMAEASIISARRENQNLIEFMSTLYKNIKKVKTNSTGKNVLLARLERQPQFEGERTNAVYQINKWMDNVFYLGADRTNRSIFVSSNEEIENQRTGWLNNYMMNNKEKLEVIDRMLQDPRLSPGQKAKLMNAKAAEVRFLSLDKLLVGRLQAAVRANSLLFKVYMHLNNLIQGQLSIYEMDASGEYWKPGSVGRAHLIMRGAVVRGATLNAAKPFTRQANKARYLIDRMQFIEDASTLEAKAMHRSASASSIKETFSAYSGIKKIEYLNQGTVLISMLVSETITDNKGNEFSVWDALDQKGRLKPEFRFDTNGKERTDLINTWEKQNSQEFLDFIGKAKTARNETSGNYDFNRSSAANNNIAGKLFLNLKRWMWTLVARKYGTVRVNYDTGRITKGRYLSFTPAENFLIRVTSSLSTGKIWNLVGAVIMFGIDAHRFGKLADEHKPREGGETINRLTMMAKVMAKSYVGLPINTIATILGQNSPIDVNTDAILGRSLRSKLQENENISDLDIGNIVARGKQLGANMVFLSTMLLIYAVSQGDFDDEDTPEEVAENRRRKANGEWWHLTKRERMNTLYNLISTGAEESRFYEGIGVVESMRRTSDIVILEYFHSVETFLNSASKTTLGLQDDQIATGPNAGDSRIFNRISKVAPLMGRDIKSYKRKRFVENYAFEALTQDGERPSETRIRGMRSKLKEKYEEEVKDLSTIEELKEIHEKYGLTFRETHKGAPRNIENIKETFAENMVNREIPRPNKPDVTFKDAKEAMKDVLDGKRSSESYKREFTEETKKDTTPKKRKKRTRKRER